MHTLEKLKSHTFSTPRQKQRLLHEIAESKGRQQLFRKQSPEVLERLLDSAIIESVRASTSMEGVIVPEHGRLREMIHAARWRPRDRDEEDVLAYKNALSFIYEKKRDLSVELIVRLSQILWAHDKAKTGLKKHDNRIVLRYPDGQHVLRFEPPSAKETPTLLETSCELYHRLIKDETLIDHQVVSAFVLDVLCIHPLEDGNGRLARLLHTMLLLQCGYDVVCYISLEGLVEQDKEHYYEALYESSKGWKTSKHSLNPWMNFSLGKLSLAYKRFERQVNEAQETFAVGLDRPESSTVEKLLETLSLGQTFDRAFIERETGVSGRTSRRTLQRWVEQGRLMKRGDGRGTRYEKIR